MGATVDGREDGRFPPLTVHGGELHGITYRVPVPSAQVKSAVLLAGLHAEGNTSVTEPAQTRDHTERALAAFGFGVEIDGLTVSVTGGRSASGLPLAVLLGKMAEPARGRMDGGLPLLDAIELGRIDIEPASIGAQFARGLLTAVLFQTRTTDTGAAAVSGTLLLVAASVACLAPSIRAARVTPLEGLKSE